MVSVFIQYHDNMSIRSLIVASNSCFPFFIFVKRCIFFSISRLLQFIDPWSRSTCFIHCKSRYHANNQSATHKDSCWKLDFKFWKNSKNMSKMSISWVDQQMTAVIVDDQPCVIIFIMLWRRETPWNNSVWSSNVDFHENAPCRQNHGNRKMKAMRCDPVTTPPSLCRMILLSHEWWWKNPSSQWIWLQNMDLKFFEHLVVVHGNRGLWAIQPANTRHGQCG